MKNIKRKSLAADKMFTSLVNEMNYSTTIKKQEFTERELVPAWL